ncbi:PREDICTED: major facilitator superfamily domain-containing protein 6 [Ceratosolen solmsi marchali]|uniref:Major facilitator superfamily domain-containing protein 6 n=1 Tax=Ceratosolen solmsi marchali TaxID=326594 RepID=A0AAJ6YDP7_9HYME|nr:PREDICTED: major facilitator superfamily domain-containing protein 6 [Ceratosolen solmsi marchali]
MQYYVKENTDFKVETSLIESKEIKSRNIPQVHEARPIVDPKAAGNVDPNLYPEAKEATHKIRGKNDFIESLFGTVDQELLTVKTFYFFFYSAFGSLFPLMGVYFKQMGMNASQCGLLIGLRPFIEFLSAPFWGSWADRWKKGKLILLASLSSWIIFTLPLGFIQPPATSCMIYKNHTNYLYIPDSDQRIQKRSVTFDNLNGNFSNMKDLKNKIYHIQYNINKFNFQRHRRSIKILSSSPGQSPISVSYAVNYNNSDHKGWVKPIFSSIVYRLPDIQKTFFLLLLLVVVGEFFSAPAITLADSAVITLLGEDTDRYGHQRMFGSLGWGLAMFFVGIALDHSTAFPDHPCGPDAKEKNYTICFAIFSVLMGAALITATQINFKYDSISIEPHVQKSPVEITREEQLQNQLSEQLNLPGLQDSIKTPQLTEDKTKIFAQTTREIPEWVTILKQFKDLKCASFLFVAWYMGFGIGLIFTFLFWHLQDYGGTPTLFGVASVINHISEIFAYFFSFRLIRQIGHVKVLCLGLGGNVIRFLYISWLKNPWWVLPFEFIQGITHAAVWAACCSYIAHNTPAPLRSNAQSVLQGLHHGLGRGCGAVIGGIFVAIYGTTATFRAYGLLCLIVLAAFIFINFYRKDTGFVSDLPQTEDPHQVAEVTHLAPHGVPSNAIPRALSSNRIHELSNQESSYGATYQTSSGNLNIPRENGGLINSNNPFLSNINIGGYSFNHITKGDDEIIRRSFQNYSEIIDTEFDIVKIPLIMTHLHIQQPCTNPFHQHDYNW